MVRAQIFRHIEAGLVALAMLQAQRLAIAYGLADWERFQRGSAPGPGLILTAICLVLMLASNLVPRRKSWLPAILLGSSVALLVLRILMAIPLAPLVAQGAALLVILAATVYFVSLLRASWRPALHGLVAALAIDIALRALNTYDLSLQPLHTFQVGGLPYLVPWAIPQAVLGAFQLGVSLLARRQARSETYDPAHVTLGFGLSLAGMLGLYHVLLGSPNVIGRWAGIPYEAVLPWLLLTVWLSLDPTVRRVAENIDHLLQPGLRVWVWLALLVLLLVVGARTTGLLAATSLIAALLVSLGFLTWRPLPGLRDQRDLTGLFTGLGFAIAMLIAMGFDVTLREASSAAFPAELAILLAAATLNASYLLLSARLIPAETHARTRSLVWLAGAPVVVLGMLLAVGAQNPLPLSSSTLRIATYNINGGFDEAGSYQLELVALSLEASRADIVILQEADTGSPGALSVDQVSFLARRLGMSSYYQPDSSRLSGTALLSRYPILSVSGYVLPDPSGRATLVQALIFNPGTGDQVQVVGGQFAAGAVDARLRQLAVLLDLTRQGGPTLLAFDFSTTPEDIVYQQLISTGFQDPDVLLGIERGFTTPSSQPSLRYDYVLVSGLEVLDARQVDSAASDHRLVVVETGWRQAP